MIINIYMIRYSSRFHKKIVNLIIILLSWDTTYLLKWMILRLSRWHSCGRNAIQYTNKINETLLFCSSDIYIVEKNYFNEIGKNINFILFLRGWKSQSRAHIFIYWLILMMLYFIMTLWITYLMVYEFFNIIFTTVLFLTGIIVPCLFIDLWKWISR